jgi:hypothetical protein
MEMAMTMTTKSILASILAAALLWSATITPSVTINQDINTGIITAVVSTSLKNRLVCKYAPIPAKVTGAHTALNINCTVNNAPSPTVYVQFPRPYQPGMQALTFGVNANSNMAITAIFRGVAALPPGTANGINYQIVANGKLSTGSF